MPDSRRRSALLRFEARARPPARPTVLLAASVFIAVSADYGRRQLIAVLLSWGMLTCFRGLMITWRRYAAEKGRFAGFVRDGVLPPRKRAVRVPRQESRARPVQPHPAGVIPREEGSRRVMEDREASA